MSLWRVAVETTLNKAEPLETTTQVVLVLAHTEIGAKRAATKHVSSIFRPKPLGAVAFDPYKTGVLLVVPEGSIAWEATP